METKDPDRAPLSPPSPPDGDMTIGFPWARKIDRELLEVANSMRSIEVLGQLVWLTNLSTEQRFLGAITGFLGSQVIASTLSYWKDEDHSSGLLEKLADGINSRPGLAKKLRPFVDSRPVESQLKKGDLGKQYLATLCACRAPLAKNQATVTFIQRLRLLILTRSLDALRSHAAIHEQTLRDICPVVRAVCEYTNDPRHSLFESLANEEVNFADFCQDLRLRCQEQRMQRGRDPSDLKILRLLEIIADGRPWVPKTEVASTTHNQEHLPPRSSQKASADLPHWARISTGPVLDTENPLPYFQNDESDGGIGIVAIDADVAEAPARNVQKGRGLILASTEHLQYLRHSWNHLGMPEQLALDSAIRLQLEVGDATAKLGAAFVLISQATSRTFFYMEQILITERIQDDWALNPSMGVFCRRPPRFGRGVKAGSDMAGWISPMSDQWQLELVKPAASALKRSIAKYPDAQSLGALWTAISPKLSLAQWFRNFVDAAGPLSRVTSTINSSRLELTVYEQTANQSLTRLINSQPRTGLSSACAYGAYKSKDVQSAQNATSADVPPMFKLTPATGEHKNAFNVCGSELDIQIDRVKSSISGLIARTNELAMTESNWVSYHNSLTCIIVLALSASTGARPINSPFERADWIDFERDLIFVEDKVAGPTRSARLCILASVAKTLIQDCYFPHIRKLAAAIALAAPSLSASMELLLGDAHDAGMPLLFFLRVDPFFDWVEVTESRLEVESGIDWPLPWNLFRHIHATSLPRMGLDSEIVDALLSHGERGAETHGDYSLRIPAQDLEQARHLVNRLFENFGFTRPTTLRSYPNGPALEINDAPIGGTRHFGKVARKLARATTREKVFTNAQHEIRTRIGDRPIDSLSEADWQEIAHAMLFRPESTLPHSAASIRYEALEDILSESWKQQRVLATMGRRYVVLPEPQAVFTEEVIVAPQQMALLRQLHESSVALLGNGKPGSVLAACLGAIELICYSRVAFNKPLLALIFLRSNIRLIRFQGKFWFEWCDAETWRDGLPVMRIEIGARCAQWIGHALSASNVRTKVPATPTALLEIQKQFHKSGDLLNLVGTLCSLQDQCNVFELPGTDAAYLAGRQRFPSVPHRDWSRAVRGQAFLAPSAYTVAPEIEPSISFMSRHHRAFAAKDTTDQLAACAEFFQAINDVLSEPDLTPDNRRSRIEIETQDRGFKNNSIPFAFAHFVVHLLQRKPENRKADRLRLSTIKRYLASLTGPLCDLGHDVSLQELDEEELTDLYTDCIDWWYDHFLKIEVKSGSNASPEGLEQARRRSAEESAADAASRALAQLKDFHEYTAQWMGLDNPDWSQIATARVGAIGRPGYILPREYERTLQALTGEVSASVLADEALVACGALILAYRFGLRVGEAIGLASSDWVEFHDAIVLLVQPNQIRPLKTVSSRRVVPLVGVLSELERSVVDEIRRRQIHQSTQGNRGSLFTFITVENFKTIKNSVSSKLLWLLKQVTRNPDCVIHFARHSFASNLFSAVRNTGSNDLANFPGISNKNVLQLLTGRETVDRRAMWGICRMLGHRSPATTQQCYVHGLESWLAHHGDVTDWDGTGISAKALLDLDLVPVDPEYGQPVEVHSLSVETNQESLFLRYLRFLRLLNMGRLNNDAGDLSRLNLHEIEDLFVQLRPVAAKVLTKKMSQNLLVELISKISPSRWQMLCTTCESVDIKSYGYESFDLLSTIGKKYQIVLFLDQHYQYFGLFVKALALANQDIALVESANILPSHTKRMQNAELLSYRRPASDFGGTFQLDATTSGVEEQRIQHRVVAVPLPQSKLLLSRVELAFLWVCWNTACASLTKPEV